MLEARAKIPPLSVFDSRRVWAMLKVELPPVESRVLAVA
jgi:hypothetical protein